jgi:hypothetical protein
MKTKELNLWAIGFVLAIVVIQLLITGYGLDKLEYIHERAKRDYVTPEVSVVVLGSPDYEAKEYGSFDKINWFNITNYHGSTHIPFRKVTIRRTK